MAYILLIEPDGLLARTYLQALEYAGHNTVWARTAQQALDAADEQTPDLIVLELQLIAYSGIAFLHELRSYGEWQKIPVIVHTHFALEALAGSETSLKKDLGVKVCLYKPRTSLRQLIAVIEEQVKAL